MKKFRTEKVYKFEIVDDMVELARDIQTGFYWGHSFYLNDDYNNRISYRDFWDICKISIEDGAKGVIISSSEVKFFHSEDEIDDKKSR